MNTVRVALFIAAWVAIWGMWKQHERIGELNTKNAALLVKLTEQVKINEDYQERVQSLHKLDTKHIQELANAKSEIDKLRTLLLSVILSGCTSKPVVKKSKALPPPAWMMQSPPDLLTPLSEICTTSFRRHLQSRENNTWLTRLY
ncbi:lysis system i-spanin subunit Rz [Providencia huaxiensis]|uniref:lysis system i-spanin subunit Rz n=1 Tax=Providencia huaxiensis TaxID=2027290 RepID=UPI0034DCC962